MCHALFFGEALSISSMGQSVRLPPPLHRPRLLFAAEAVAANARSSCAPHTHTHTHTHTEQCPQLASLSAERSKIALDTYDRLVGSCLLSSLARSLVCVTRPTFASVRHSRAGRDLNCCIDLRPSLVIKCHYTSTASVIDALRQHRSDQGTVVMMLSLLKTKAHYGAGSFQFLLVLTRSRSCQLIR
jgi:hypothetical protein